MLQNTPERDQQKPVGKITPAARERMKERTAQQQLNDTLRELMTPPDDVPDADDSSAKPEPPQ